VVAASWSSPTNLLQGAGAGLLVLFLGWLYVYMGKKRDMRASEADLEQTKDLELRDMVATMYAGLITADPTPMNPNPQPGLIERVETMADTLHAHLESDAENFQTIQTALAQLVASDDASHEAG
jgi:hypothetical protein